MQTAQRLQLNRDILALERIIATGTDAMQTLAILNAKTSPLTVTEQKIARETMRSTGIAFEARHYSEEGGITDFLLKVWRAVINAIKAMLKKVGEIIGQLFGTGAKSGGGYRSTVEKTQETIDKEDFKACLTAYDQDHQFKEWLKDKTFPIKSLPFPAEGHQHYMQGNHFTKLAKYLDDTLAGLTDTLVLAKQPTEYDVQFFMQALALLTEVKRISALRQSDNSFSLDDRAIVALMQLDYYTGVKAKRSSKALGNVTVVSYEVPLAGIHGRTAVVKVTMNDVKHQGKTYYPIMSHSLTFTPDENPEKPEDYVATYEGSLPFVLDFSKRMEPLDAASKSAVHVWQNFSEEAEKIQGELEDILKALTKNQVTGVPKIIGKMLPIISAYLRDTSGNLAKALLGVNAYSNTLDALTNALLKALKAEHAAYTNR